MAHHMSHDSPATTFVGASLTLLGNGLGWFTSNNLGAVVTACTVVAAGSAGGYVTVMGILARWRRDQAEAEAKSRATLEQTARENREADEALKLRLEAARVAAALMVETEKARVERQLQAEKDKADAASISAQLQRMHERNKEYNVTMLAYQLDIRDLRHQLEIVNKHWEATVKELQKAQEQNQLLLSQLQSSTSQVTTEIRKGAVELHDLTTGINDRVVQNSDRIAALESDRPPSHPELPAFPAGEGSL